MKKNDIILLFAVSAVCIAALFLLKINRPADTVIIKTDGEIFCEKRLSEDCEIDINGTNTAVIENGEVYMLSADCPDKLCVHQGKISDSSEKIICLPNRVIIEVTKKSEIDAVVK